MVDKTTIFSTVLFSNLYTWDVKRFNIAEISYNKNYNIVPFSKVLKEATMEWVQIEDDKQYSILGVRTYGKGVYINRTSIGKDLKMKKYQKSQKDHLFWCKVDTKNGAFGVITENFENSYGSSNMSYLKIRTDRIELNYLQLLFQSVKLNEYMDSMVVGVTNRKYISKDDLLSNIFIPLPTITEQKILVKKHEDALAEAEQCEKEVERLEASIDEYLFDILGIEITEETTPSKEHILTFTNLKKMFKWGADYNINAINPKDVFRSTKFKNTPILSLCEINPTTKYSSEIEEISFVPMECVSDIYGEISSKKNGTTSESKGYTRFKENDVIWAKITPCMQNGKSAVAKDLTNGFAYGSTEYHVFRTFENQIIPEYLHAFLRSKRIRKIAKTYFTGSAGQQRVGADFLEALTLPYVPIKSDDINEITQSKIVTHIEKIKDKIKFQREKAKHLRELAKKEFEEAVFNEA